MLEQWYFVKMPSKNKTPKSKAQSATPAKAAPVANQTIVEEEEKEEFSTPPQEVETDVSAENQAAEVGQGQLNQNVQQTVAGAAVGLGNPLHEWMLQMTRVLKQPGPEYIESRVKEAIAYQFDISRAMPANIFKRFDEIARIVKKIPEECQGQFFDTLGSGLLSQSFINELTLQMEKESSMGLKRYPDVQLDEYVPEETLKEVLRVYFYSQYNAAKSEEKISLYGKFLFTRFKPEYAGSEGIAFGRVVEALPAFVTAKLSHDKKMSFKFVSRVFESAKSEKLALTVYTKSTMDFDEGISLEEFKKVFPLKYNEWIPTVEFERKSQSESGDTQRKDRDAEKSFSGSEPRGSRSPGSSGFSSRVSRGKDRDKSKVDAQSDKKVSKSVDLADKLIHLFDERIRTDSCVACGKDGHELKSCSTASEQHKANAKKFLGLLYKSKEQVKAAVERHNKSLEAKPKAAEPSNAVNFTFSQAELEGKPGNSMSSVNKVDSIASVLLKPVGGETPIVKLAEFDSGCRMTREKVYHEIGSEPYYEKDCVDGLLSEQTVLESGGKINKYTKPQHFGTVTGEASQRIIGNSEMEVTFNTRDGDIFTVPMTFNVVAGLPMHKVLIGLRAFKCIFEPKKLGCLSFSDLPKGFGSASLPSNPQQRDLLAAEPVLPETVPDPGVKIPHGLEADFEYQEKWLQTVRESGIQWLERIAPLIGGKKVEKRFGRPYVVCQSFRKDFPLIEAAVRQVETMPKDSEPDRVTKEWYLVMACAPELMEESTYARVKELVKTLVKVHFQSMEGATGWSIPPFEDRPKANCPEVKAYHGMYVRGDARVEVREELTRRVERGEFRRLAEKPERFSPPFLVPSKSEKRLVIDYSAANERVEDLDWPTMEVRTLIDLAVERAGRDPKKVFINAFDFLKCYQNLKYTDPHNLYAVAFENMFLSPERMPTGIKNAPAFLAKAVDSIFGELKEEGAVVNYMDDGVNSNDSEESCEQNLLKIVALCEKYNIRLKLQGCRYFQERVSMIGFEVGVFEGNEIGYRKSPRHMAELLQFVAPKTYKDICFVVFLSQFCGKHVLDYARKIKPIADLLKGKPADKATLARMPFPPELWNAECKRALEQLKKYLEHQLTHTIPRGDLMNALIHDASSTGLACVHVQFDEAEWSRPYEQRTYHIIATHCRRFTEQEQIKHIRELEFLSLFEGASVLQQYFRGLRGPLIAYTDHKPLEKLNIPEPKSLLSLGALRRMQLLLKEDLQIRVIAIPGALNVVDPITRPENDQPRMVEMPVVRPSENQVDAVSTRAVDREAPMQPPVPEFKVVPRELNPLGIPMLKKLGELSSKDKKPCEDAVWGKQMPLWTRTIPSTGRPVVCVTPEMKEFVLVVSHNHHLCHAGLYGTLAFCEKYFWWSTMQDDVKKHVGDCVTCQMVKAKNTHPPQGVLYKGTVPFEQLTIDYAEMPEALTGERYFLAMNDPFTGHVVLKASLAETGEDAAQKILDYGTTYVFPRTIWSDKAKHFKQKMMDELARLTDAFQFFGTANAPWTKGVIERTVRTLKEKMLLILAELRVPVSHWPRYVGMVQAAINNTPSERLGGYSPNEILFRGTNQLPWFIVYDQTVQAVKQHDLNENVLSLIEGMHESLTSMSWALEKSRYEKEGQRQLSSQRFSFAIPLAVGDDVMIAEDKPSIGLAPKWAHVGRIVKKENDWVYKVRDLITNVVKEYHVAKLRPFAGHRFNQTLNNWESVFWQALEVHGVGSVTKFRVADQGRLECYVHWADLKKTPSWESAQVWVAKIPRYFKTLLASEICEDPAIKTKLEGFLQKAGM